MKERKTNADTPPCVKKSMSPIRESVKAATAVKIFTFWILSKFVNLRENTEPSKFAIQKKSSRQNGVCVWVWTSCACVCVWMSLLCCDGDLTHRAVGSVDFLLSERCVRWWPLRLPRCADWQWRRTITNGGCIGVRLNSLHLHKWSEVLFGILPKSWQSDMVMLAHFVVDCRLDLICELNGTCHCLE